MAAKIKVRPEDFIVEELIDVPLADKGAYTILKLDKKYWNTLDVIDFVCRKAKVRRTLFDRAGLKDRYAQSTQYLSFKGDFQQTITETNFTLRPIGKSNRAVNPSMLRGNSFRILIRDLSRSDIGAMDRNMEEVKSHGFPNYFDDQRFGSARHGQGFIAKKLILEHYQGALKLLLCHAYKEDNAAEKRFKGYCMSHWRDWSGCARIAPPQYRPILHHLMAHPKDFKNALKTIDREYLNLYLLAYQSYLFNETLARIVRDRGEENVNLRYSMGEFTFHRKVRQDRPLASTRIPMVNEKTVLSGPVGACIERVLAKEGITLKRMSLAKMRLRGVRFKPFMREAVVSPADISVSDPEPDDLYAGNQKRLVRCTLPAGTYATILIKRLLLRP